MHKHGHDDPKAQKLYAMIKDMRIAMMTTIDTEGLMHSRPMYSQEADEHGDLWFFTQIQSPKTTEISRDNEVNLSYSDPDKQHYVSVFGTAEIVRDKKKIEEKWSEGMRAWFPNGTDDPQIALIRVHPVRGEYWDSPNSTILHLYGTVKAAITGKQPNELTEDEKVNLKG
ncbi:MAG TPA: pyridoxamine 5'-phosphate oxidase family protein [Microvirga sp.]|jgi:general stress protein 26|nr:pyridoxamine 5'-phosphate oxidase family protein [Microvirga sp.]